ncbi:CoA ester lyase [Parvibaculum sp.]|jgi:citrate lyase subunit beta / citryl-CoA lyase|uniref:HpcH/HpaI aldolase/citrate lyase family protein n=1 Tax=Parvibaculum sp. TaxID=2024848 RepID=UPI000C566AEE|nr:CoA ester lyase [Parvibaculum sp.]MAM93988.1 CoA ester lyase [Parvibaculum sp.]HCX69258.1 CoA ester lyase [Rhodobiaceae bacterium]|tara:strand:+ start:15409 stop:16257 length:849 start_codon:yes stop_codon:yes gene_type:complete
MRSFLFVPADSEKKLAKAASCGADALVLDLEDSVALSAKDTARNTAVAYLKTADRSGPKLILRINALDTPFWEKDLEAVIPARPDLIVVPKTLSGGCVTKVGDRIDRMGGADEIGIGCVATETAASLFTLGTYAGSHKRLSFLTWGAEDLSAALGARNNKDENGLYTGPYQLARTLTLLGAVAAGVQPVDGVWTDFRDEKGLEAEARAAARDGFTGKMAIHPAQVAIINEVFTPSEADLAHARAVVAAFEQAGDVGVVALDGVMLDIPHLKQARALLARATQ